MQVMTIPFHYFDIMHEIIVLNIAAAHIYTRFSLIFLVGDHILDLGRCLYYLSHEKEETQTISFLNLIKLSLRLEPTAG